MSDAEKDEVTHIRARLASLDAERAVLEERLAAFERRCDAPTSVDRPAAQAANPTTITTSSSTAEKVSLFRRLFAGRPDIFPVRWENQKAGRSGYAPACANEWAKGICDKPRVKCGECPHQAFIPVSDDIIEKHLRGGNRGRHADADFVAGVYPLLSDETCWFLAADFDKGNWMADAAAMIDTCHAKDVPAALERSRSGNGGHVWIFFSEPVSAHGPSTWFGAPDGDSGASTGSVLRPMIASFPARIPCRSAVWQPHRLPLQEGARTWQ